MKRSVVPTVILGLLIVTAAVGETAPPWGLELGGGVSLPVGQSAAAYTAGGGGGVAVTYRLPGLPLLTVRSGLDLAVVPTLADSVLLLATGLAGAGLSVDLLPWLGLEAYLLAGWGQGFYQGQSGGSAVIAFLARVQVVVVPAFAVAAGAAYRHYFSQPDPFYQGLGIELAAVIRLGG